MKITVNTDVLKKHSITLGEFLIMLIGYYEIDFQKCHDSVIGKNLAERNLFKELGVILSNNNKNLVAQILMESDDRVIHSGINFESLAKKLQEVYPDGIKSGTTYPWRGTTDEIAQKLRTLVVKYDFSFTEEEAINAVKEYIESFKEPCQYTLILKNFILWVHKDKTGCYEMESMFMTIVENNRKKQ